MKKRDSTISPEILASRRLPAFEFAILVLPLRVEIFKMNIEHQHQRPAAATNVKQRMTQKYTEFACN